MPSALPDPVRPAGKSPGPAWLRKVGLTVVFLWFFIGGIAHFVATDAQMRIVPSWVPWPREAVLATGALELLGAIALLWPGLRRIAGGCLVLLTLAVTPANVVMLEQAADYPSIPYWALVARLPLQALLVVLIIWSTAKPRRPH